MAGIDSDILTRTLNNLVEAYELRDSRSDSPVI